MSAVVTLPFLRWTSVVAAWEPAREATAARLRTLRKRRAVSAGVTVQQRGPKGASGSTTLMCSLNLFAAVLERRGDHAAAASYAKAAHELEEVWAQELRAIFAHGDVFDRRSDWLRSFACDVERRRKSLPEVQNFVLLEGRVASVNGSWVRLEGLGAERERTMDLPLEMLAKLDLTPGDFAVVFRDLLPSGMANIWCLPGVALSGDSTCTVSPDSAESSLSGVQRRAFEPMEATERDQALSLLNGNDPPRVLRPAG